MLKKRLVGVVTVKNGWAVQSFGYRRYLPLGRPEVLVENLDRWGADEILLQCVDRSARQAGPDLALLERVSALGLSTPLIYAGGIASVEAGIAVIKAGADRLCLDAALHDDSSLCGALAEPLGAQAIIAALPLSRNGDKLMWLDHRNRREVPLGPALMEQLVSSGVSETLVIDWRNEGRPAAFDPGLAEAFPLESMPLILFGGLSEPAQMAAMLGRPNVVAVGVGNFLSYSEHAIQSYKQQLPGLPLRPASYLSSTEGLR